MATGDILGVWSPLSNEPPASSYATLDTRNAHPVLEFDQSSNESAVFSGRMPPNYGGGGVTVEVWWAVDGVTSGDVDWDVAIERLADGGQDIDSDGFAAANSADNNTVPGTDGQLERTDIAFTDGADMDSVAAGDLFRIKVTRDAASDTAAADAQVRMVVLRET